MKRQIIKIDEDKCTGCAECVPNCPEGAIQIIDGKARLISDLFCDGLGACIGHCPEGAITIEEREAEPYDESKVMENIVRQGSNVIRAHLEHLREHGQHEFLQEALMVLGQKGIDNPLMEAPSHGPAHHEAHGGCPGARAFAFSPQDTEPTEEAGQRRSHLTHWPIQMHLISPRAPHFQGSDLLLAADCVAFTLGDFHKDHLQGKTLAIACPKLDEGQQIYLEKLRALVDEAQINTLTVMIMQVPCCTGLLQLAIQAVEQADRPVPVKMMVVGIQGQILREEWVWTGREQQRAAQAAR